MVQPPGAPQPPVAAPNPAPAPAPAPVAQAPTPAPAPEVQPLPDPTAPQNGGEAAVQAAAVAPPAADPPKKRRKRRTKAEIEAEKSAKAAEQAPEVPVAPVAAPSAGSPGADGYTLFVDCLPVNEPVTSAEDLIDEANKLVCQANESAHYKLIDFGKGPGLLQVALEHLITNGSKPVGAVVLGSTTGADALPVLQKHAARVVRGLR